MKLQSLITIEYENFKYKIPIHHLSCPNKIYFYYKNVAEV